MNEVVSANVQLSMVTKYSYIDNTGKIVIDASGYDGSLESIGELWKFSTQPTVTVLVER